MRTLTFASLFVFALSGCFAGTVDGDVHGDPLVVQSAIFFELDDDSVIMVVSDYPNLCERIDDDEALIADFRGVFFQLFNVDGDKLDKIEDGKYELLDFNSGTNVGDGFFGLAFAVEYDDDCEEKVDVAEDGRVKVEKYERGETLNFTFKTEFDGDDLEGTIRATFCDVDAEDILSDAESCEE